MADLGNRLKDCENELMAAGYSGNYLEAAKRPFEVAADGDFYTKVITTRRLAERKIGERLPAEFEQRLDNLYALGIKQNGPENANRWYERAFELAEKDITAARIYARRAERIAQEAGIKFKVDWDALENYGGKR